MILPLDSTDASHKQINERQCNVMHINTLPPKPVTKYATLTVNVADKLAALLLSRSHLGLATSYAYYLL